MRARDSTPTAPITPRPPRMSVSGNSHCSARELNPPSRGGTSAGCRTYQRIGNEVETGCNGLAQASHLQIACPTVMLQRPT